MHLSDLRKSGHAPSLFSAFLHFDISFMVWVILGAIMPFIITDPALTGSNLRVQALPTVTSKGQYTLVIKGPQTRRENPKLAADQPSTVYNLLIKPGDYVPGNMYFTTTRLHQELAGGNFVDVIVDEAHDPQNQSQFKGNVDLQKYIDLIERVGAEKIAYITIGATVNMAGGQPISMANLRAVYQLSQEHKIKVVLDATRAMENAFFIKQREMEFANKTIKEILLEMCSYSDAATMSGKKDLLVNIGGFLALNDDDLFEEARNMVVIYEGLHTYGGLAGRDMEAMARGIEEACHFDHLRARIGQVEYVGNRLLELGVPIVTPIGGHAVFLDAKKFYPQLEQLKFPAQTLASELYLDSGIRAMERGIVSAGRNKETGDHYFPKLELVRLTFPRRVYTQAHCDVTVESVFEVWQNRTSVKGLKMIYEPKYLRFFQARFERI